MLREHEIIPNETSNQVAPTSGTNDPVVEVISSDEESQDEEEEEDDDDLSCTDISPEKGDISIADLDEYSRDEACQDGENDLLCEFAAQVRKSVHGDQLEIKEESVCVEQPQMVEAISSVQEQVHDSLEPEIDEKEIIEKGSVESDNKEIVATENKEIVAAENKEIVAAEDKEIEAAVAKVTAEVEQAEDETSKIASSVCSEHSIGCLPIQSHRCRCFLSNNEITEYNTLLDRARYKFTFEHFLTSPQACNGELQA